jgi:hypothetical protein
MTCVGSPGVLRRIPERHGQDWLANVQVEALEVLFSVPVALTDIIDERPRPRCLELGCLRGPPSTADASGTGSRSARERYLVSVAQKAMVKGNGMPVGSDVREWLRAAQRAEAKVIAAIHKAEAAEPMPRHHQRLTLDHGSLTIGIDYQGGGGQLKDPVVNPRSSHGPHPFRCRSTGGPVDRRRGAPHLRHRGRQPQPCGRRSAAHRGYRVGAGAPRGSRRVRRGRRG